MIIYSPELTAFVQSISRYNLFCALLNRIGTFPINNSSNNWMWFCTISYCMIDVEEMSYRSFNLNWYLKSNMFRPDLSTIGNTLCSEYTDSGRTTYPCPSLNVILEDICEPVDDCDILASAFWFARSVSLIWCFKYVRIVPS